MQATERTIIQLTASHPISAISETYSQLQQQGRAAEHYLTDLLHDGAWIQRNCFDGRPFKFYWAARQCGTNIGTDKDLVSYGTVLGLFLVRVQPTSKWNSSAGRSCVEYTTKVTELTL